MSEDSEQQSNLSSSSSSSFLSDSRKSMLATMLAGPLAGMVARVATHPLDTCKAKMQVSSAKSPLPQFRSLSSVFLHTCQNESIVGLYRGIGISLTGAVPAACLYFLIYEKTKETIKKNITGGVWGGEFATHFISGFAAEAGSCVFWVPVDVVKERLQIQSNLSSLVTGNNNNCNNNNNINQKVSFGARGYDGLNNFKNQIVENSIESSLRGETISTVSSSSSSSSSVPYKYNGNVDALRKIVEKEGIRGLYRGYGATLASFGPFSALYFVFYEEFKKWGEKWMVGTKEKEEEEKKKRDLPFALSLVVAGSAGAAASFVTNPLDMAKLRLQVQRAAQASSSSSPAGAAVGEGVNFRYRHTVDALVNIVKKEGITALFRGSVARMLFHAPATAITLALYEKFRVAIEKSL